MCAHKCILEIQTRIRPLASIGTHLYVPVTCYSSLYTGRPVTPTMATRGSSSTSIWNVFFSKKKIMFGCARS